MRTSDVILAEMRALECESAAFYKELVTVEGWYECEDGTYCRCYWVNGQLKERAHVRDIDAAIKWDALDAEGAEAFDFERRQGSASHG